jgi:hypothetical protein
MSVFFGHERLPEPQRIVCRTKPDLRLAESYLPALLLCIKGMGYSAIAPITLMLPWRLALLAVALLGLLLYVDHLYLVLPHVVFIDTTALSLDVFAGTLLVIAMTLLKPCSQQCQAILGLWTLCSATYLLIAQQAPKPLVHAVAFAFVVAFIYWDLGHPLSPVQSFVLYNHSAPLPSVAAPPSISFFARTALYLSLSLVDVYLLRPVFQQENERMLFCKYGPVLLGAWPWCLGFWVVLAALQLLKRQQTATLAASLSACQAPPALSSSSSPPDTHLNVHDLDVMEAFRLAKQQHMGGKGAN